MRLEILLRKGGRKGECGTKNSRSPASARRIYRRRMRLEILLQEGTGRANAELKIGETQCRQKEAFLNMETM